MDAALWNAYQATTFVAEIDGVVVRIRPGQPHPDLDHILASLSLGQWAFITAWNPRSQLLSPVENDRRHEELRAAVAEFGYESVEGDGIPAEANWRSERSLLVLGITEDDALALGRRFGQYAIVVGEHGRSARLLACEDQAV